MNLVNMQVTVQDFETQTGLCANGTGFNITNTGDCSGDYNTEFQNNYAKTAQYYPSSNCGSRVFAHGTGS